MRPPRLLLILLLCRWGSLASHAWVVLIFGQNGSCSVTYNIKKISKLGPPSLQIFCLSLNLFPSFAIPPTANYYQHLGVRQEMTSVSSCLSDKQIERNVTPLLGHFGGRVGICAILQSLPLPLVLPSLSFSLIALSFLLPLRGCVHAY